MYFAIAACRDRRRPLALLASNNNVPLGASRDSGADKEKKNRRTDNCTYVTMTAEESNDVTDTCCQSMDLDPVYSITAAAAEDDCEADDGVTGDLDLNSTRLLAPNDVFCAGFRNCIDETISFLTQVCTVTWTL